MRRIGVLLLLLLLPDPVAGADGKRPIDQVLRGRFVSLDGDRIVLRYDFSDPAQLEDWTVKTPYRVAGDLAVEYENKAVRLKGVGVWRHRVPFDGEGSIEFEIRPFKDRDFGVAVVEDAESDQFVLYSVNDLYFQKFDGAKEPGHMITRFGIIDASEPKGNFVFRYVCRGKSPDIRKFETLKLKAEKKGVDDTFTIGDRTYQGVEMGRKLLDWHVGIYFVESEGIVDEVIVSGKVSPRWIEKEKVEMVLSKPIDTEEPESKAEKAAAEKIGQFRAGELPGVKLLEVVADPDVSKDRRAEAATALMDSGDKTLVPHLVPLLYSADLPTREHAYDLVRKLVGKTFGYSPKGDEDKRSAAIQKLIQHIQKNAAEFGSGR